MEASAKSVYTRLEDDREPFLERARDAASLTIPSLMPRGATGSMPYQNRGQDLSEPYQSVGARGVNNLASKLLLSLFPVNAKFFRLAVDEGALQELGAFKQAETEVQEALSQIEDTLLDDLEAMGLRIKLYEALRQIVSSGNALIHLPFGNAPRVYRLDSYVVERDPRGNLLKIVVQQHVSPLVLDEKTRSAISATGADVTPGKTKTVEVFTVVERVINQGEPHWKEWQEVNGKRIGPLVTHEFRRLPYIPLRMYTTDGEAYGRSHVEQYLPDLRALNALSQALQEGSAASAKVIMLVNPDGPTRIRRLAKAKNGEYIPGREVDVSPLQLNKMADFTVVRQEMAELKRDLGFVFMLNSTVQRQAERVTSEEIRYVAQELEDTLGGTFSLLSADLQMPLVDIILGNMQDGGRSPELPEEVRPVVVTGLAAIGRGHDLRRLDEFLHGALQTFGPEVAQYVNVGIYLQQRATALGIDTAELIKSQEQLAQEQQQANAAKLTSDLAPSLIKANPEGAADVAQQVAEQQMQQTA